MIKYDKSMLLEIKGWSNKNYKIRNKRGWVAALYRLQNKFSRQNYNLESSRLFTNRRRVKYGRAKTR